MRALVLALLAACSIPDKHALGGDAPLSQDGSQLDAKQLDAASGAPYACLGQPLPTTAPAMFTISGQSYSLSSNGSQPLASVVLNGYVSTQMAPIITVTTDGGGNYSVVVPSGGVPVDGHVVGSLATYLTANIYPSRPIDSDTNIPVTMITAQTMSLAAQLSGASVMNNMAQVAVYVVDCNNMPIAGATIQVTNNTTMAPTGAVRYFSGGLPNQNAMLTDSSGTAFVFNTTGGAMTIHATAPAGTLRAHTFTAPADAAQWTEVTIQP